MQKPLGWLALNILKLGLHQGMPYLEEQDPALPETVRLGCVGDWQLSSTRDPSRPATHLVHLLLQLFKNALSRFYWQGYSESKRLSTLSRAPASKDRDRIRVDSKAIWLWSLTLNSQPWFRFPAQLPHVQVIYSFRASVLSILYKMGIRTVSSPKGCLAQSTYGLSKC